MFNISNLNKVAAFVLLQRAGLQKQDKIKLRKQMNHLWIITGSQSV